jgi:ubiquinone/menaquinone biosynthesis C-methylase UbiE
MIFLPGTDKQINILLNNLSLNEKPILVVGSNSEEIAKSLGQNYSSKVILIVDNNDSLMRSRLLLSKEKNISARMMEFDNTDFNDSSFELVYAQASISNFNRNKIVKEIKRILKPGGYLCTGEIVSLADKLPKFIENIFATSNLDPLHIDKLNEYYSKRSYKIIYEENISGSLREFYLKSRNYLDTKNLDENEKIYYKKLLKQISHESNIYLKMNGDKYIGFKALLLQKNN